MQLLARGVGGPKEPNTLSTRKLFTIYPCVSGWGKHGTERGEKKKVRASDEAGEIPPALIDSYFLDGQIERVEISRGNKDWHIVISKENLVPAQAYRTFCLRMREKLQHIAKVSFLFLYDEKRLADRSLYKSTGDCS